MGRMDFLGTSIFKDKSVNRQGHEGTQRKTLGLGVSFVVLRVLSGLRL
jgi:hypothetical protein